MKNCRVSVARWANWRDMKLPYYRQWNKENPLPAHFWQRIWEYPFVALQIPGNQPCLDVGGTYPFVLFKNFPKAISVDNRNLNELDHPLHKNQWPAGSLSVQDAHHLEFSDDAFNYAFCISALEEMSDPFEVLNELLRVTRWKLVVTTDISEHLGINAQQLTQLARILNFDIPPMPTDCLVSDDSRLRSWGISPTSRYRHIRTLGLVIESVDTITSCGIIIPHFESYNFASAAIRNIRKQKNARINHHIYLIDDDSKDGSFHKLTDEVEKSNDITLWQVERKDKFNSNVGFLLDEAVKKVKEKYVCMTDADACPISPHWLSFPIWLLEKYYCSSVGCDTGLSSAYLPNKLYHWQNNDVADNGFGVYDNENFSCTNNFYRLMKTSLAQVVSEKAGFARHSRAKSGNSDLLQRVSNKISRLTRKYLRIMLSRDNLMSVFKESDNGVIANYFMDINRLGPKFNLPLLSWVGFTPHDGVFGQNISDLLFHFALSTRALSRWRREISEVGDEYKHYAEIIQENGFGDDLLKELLQKQELRPGGYDGNIPVKWYQDAQRAMGEEFKKYLEENS
jgi:hypothetical protein